jgi:fused signal recognition particle receptor
MKTAATPGHPARPVLVPPAQATIRLPPHRACRVRVLHAPLTLVLPGPVPVGPAPQPVPVVPAPQLAPAAPVRVLRGRPVLPVPVVPVRALRVPVVPVPRPA